VEYVLSGGNTSATTVGNNGVLVVYGAASGTQVNSGGYDLVGGTVSGTHVNSGSEYVLAGGITTGAVISNGLEVLFGVGSGTVLSGSASEFVSSGATAVGTTVNSGTIDYVLAGGLASGTHLNGGQQIDYGTVTGAIITAGTQDVEGGAVANATALSGGFEYVLSGGTASGTTINGSGYEYVFSGGSANGTIISSGTLEVASGGTANVITFSSGGLLRLDDAVHFGGLVAGFNVPADHLDLRNIAYISGTTTSSWTQLTSGANASGTLSISDGTPGTTANITLLGQYTAGNFHVTTDGAGGTLVTDPPVTATDPNPLVAAFGTRHG